LLDIIAKNKAQAIASFGNVIQSLGTPITVLSVPLGRKAIVNGIIWMVQQGSATQGRLVANGVIIARWVIVGGRFDDNQPEDIFIRVRLRVKDLQIDGGQTLMLTSNADPTGNVEFKRQFSILELPA